MTLTSSSPRKLSPLRVAFFLSLGLAVGSLVISACGKGGSTGPMTVASYENASSYSGIDPSGYYKAVLAYGRDNAADQPTRLFDLISGIGFATIAPYGEWPGTVRVALGDVDGDGVLDILMATGPGAIPYVRILSGADGSLLREFVAFDSSFRGGVFVAAGDVDGDGKADIIVSLDAGAVPANETSTVKIFSGADGHLIQGLNPYPGFAGGLRVAAADVDGDGRADVVVATGPGRPSEFRVFGSRLWLNLLSDALIPYSGYSSGLFVATGDFDGDGKAEIVCSTDQGHDSMARFTVIRVSDGAALLDVLKPYPNFQGGVRIAVADMNGDGVPDIITSAGPGTLEAGVPIVQAFDGATGKPLASPALVQPRGPVFPAARPGLLPKASSWIHD